MKTITERLEKLKETLRYNSSPAISSIQVGKDDLRALLAIYDENTDLRRKNRELRALARLFRLASKNGIEREEVEAKLSEIKLYLRELGYEEDSLIPKDEAYEVMKNVQVENFGSSFLPQLESYTTETFSYISTMITLMTLSHGKPDFFS